MTPIVVEGPVADILINTACDSSKIETVYEDYEVYYFIGPLPGGYWLTWNDLASHEAVICGSRAEVIEYLAQEVEKYGLSIEGDALETARYMRLATDIRAQARD